MRLIYIAGPISGNTIESLENIRAGIEAGVKVLRVEARDCPACMLAAIRQSGIQQGGDEEGFFRIPFDYTREKNRYWTEHNGRDRL